MRLFVSPHNPGIWCLGVKWGEEYAAFRVHQHKPLHLSTLHHDALVTSVRLRLEELLACKWIPETYFKQEGGKLIPDGMMRLGDGSPIVIEVENSQKNRRRFEKLLLDWGFYSIRQDEAIALVLYIASTPAVFDVLHRRLQNAPPFMAYGLMLWERLDAGETHFWSTRGPLDLRDLRL